MTLPDLKEYADTVNLSRSWPKKKDDLIMEIEKHVESGGEED